MVKFIKKFQNCQNCHQKLSTKIVIKTCQQKLSSKIVINNCHQKLTLKTVIKNCHQELSSEIVIKNCHQNCLLGHSVLLWTLWLLVVPRGPTNQGTWSPIELFWTAKKTDFDHYHRLLNNCSCGSNKEQVYCVALFSEK